MLSPALFDLFTAVRDQYTSPAKLSGHLEQWLKTYKLKTPPEVDPNDFIPPPRKSKRVAPGPESLFVASSEAVDEDVQKKVGSRSKRQKRDKSDFYDKKAKWIPAVLDEAL